MSAALWEQADDNQAGCNEGPRCHHSASRVDRLQTFRSTFCRSLRLRLMTRSLLT